MFQSCKSKFINFDIFGGLCFYFWNEFPSENFVWEISVAKDLEASNYSVIVLGSLFVLKSE